MRERAAPPTGSPRRGELAVRAAHDRTDAGPGAERLVLAAERLVVGAERLVLAAERLVPGAERAVVLRERLCTECKVAEPLAPLRDSPKREQQRTRVLVRRIGLRWEGIRVTERVEVRAVDAADAPD